MSQPPQSSQPQQGQYATQQAAIPADQRTPDEQQLDQANNSPWRRWNDPLQLIQNEEPAHIGRLVLWLVSILMLLTIAWAVFGKLDIVVSAQGKLVPQNLIKIVQPAESGVVKTILVKEGDAVQAGQVLVQLDTTLANADQKGISADLALQQMQQRRIQAELSGSRFTKLPEDDAAVYLQASNQLQANRRAQQDALAQEQSQLTRIQSEHTAAQTNLQRMEQALPSYIQSAESYQNMAAQDLVPKLLAVEKQREADDKTKERDAQQSNLKALSASIQAQRKRIAQIKSSYRSQLQQQLLETQAKISQLKPTLRKTQYRQTLMELKAPEDGIVKDLATTTTGAVVQPGTILLTLVPQDEKLYADVTIRNEDIGFVEIGQAAQVKIAAFPFQKYGLIESKIIRISPDATEAPNQPQQGNPSAFAPQQAQSTYKARVELGKNTLTGPDGDVHTIQTGMQVVAEINQGKRTVLEYILSPINKAVKEAARER